ncbi:isomerase [Streptomyces abyssalis]|uniref:2-hydroxychromene-2-carboxylate isomerase n=1 Tax=Streptomyces abyssalis TaxID=933944 RepID=A0A1E7JMV2_9ACTN|nr:DsbA family protein [Streptomyces abyssalis]OEU87003.1 isomerase [Streptomyces abyssalis]OEU89612.1 isomerase [Streptomyces abyssalis]OEV21093.1 isomerase [Streptomyces nanshensis]
MPRQRAVPRVYFSLRSPYSWLACAELTSRYPDVARASEWRPFWEPDAQSRRMLTEAGGDFPYVAMSRAKHLYVLQDVRRLAKERGLTVSWPLDRDPCWEVPHLAYLLARDEGRGGDFIEAASRTRWAEGGDICDPSVVAGLAAGLTLPQERLAKAASDPGVRERGVAALLDVHKDGVFGVPFFVHGFEKFWGLDRLAAFAASVRGERAGDEHHAAPASGGPVMPAEASDQGHAGGCG